MAPQAKTYGLVLIGRWLAVALVASGCSAGSAQHMQGCTDTQGTGCEGYWNKGQRHQEELLTDHGLPAATPLSSSPSSSPSPLLPQESPGGGFPSQNKPVQRK